MYIQYTCMRIYMYICMYIYIVQTSQYKESKFHFRAKLLLSNFSSALGISIRHACFFFFASLLLFMNKQVYHEERKEKFLSCSSSLLWSCSAVLFHNHNCIFFMYSRINAYSVQSPSTVTSQEQNSLLTNDFHHLIVFSSHCLEMSTGISSSECWEAVFQDISCGHTAWRYMSSGSVPLKCIFVLKGLHRLLGLHSIEHTVGT